MSTPADYFTQLFFEVFESLPRQGPGSRNSAAQALSFCGELPSVPLILDLGCGSGSQTFHLAELTSGSVVALDSHAPSIDKLRAAAASRGYDSRIRAVVGDMSKPDLPRDSFDLIWSEGAFYNIGIACALDVCRPLLRAGGYLAFTDAVWRKENPPASVKAVFDQDYPGMGRAEEIVALIQKAGFALIGQLMLPDEDWWDDFYTPMELRIDELRQKYSGDKEALAALAALAEEPEMHRRHAACYGYSFFIARLAK